jgi:hypothetical protein
MRCEVVPRAAGFCSCSASLDSASRYVRLSDDECGSVCEGEEALSPPRRCGGEWRNAVYRNIPAPASAGASAGADCYAECRMQLAGRSFEFVTSSRANVVEWAWAELLPAFHVETLMARVLHQYVRGVHAELQQLTSTLGGAEAARPASARMPRRFALIGSTCGDAPGSAGPMYTAVLRARAWARVGYTPIIVLAGTQWDDAAAGGRLERTACGEVLAAIDGSGVEVIRARSLARAYAFPALLHAGALARAGGRLEAGDFVMVAPPRVLPLSADHFGAARDWSKRAHLYDSLCAECFPCSVKHSANCTIDAYRAESVFVGIQARPSHGGCDDRWNSVWSQMQCEAGLPSGAAPLTCCAPAGGGAERGDEPLGCGGWDRQRSARAVPVREYAACAVCCYGLVASDGDEVS